MAVTVAHGGRTFRSPPRPPFCCACGPFWMLGDKVFPVALVFMFFSATLRASGSRLVTPQGLVPCWRTQAAAMLLFILNLLGMGLGPLVVAVKRYPFILGRRFDSLRFVEQPDFLRRRGFLPGAG